MTDDVPDSALGKRFLEAEQLVRELADELQASIDRGKTEVEAAKSLASAASAIEKVGRDAKRLVTKMAATHGAFDDAASLARSRFEELDASKVVGSVTTLHAVIAELQGAIAGDVDARIQVSAALTANTKMVEELGSRLARVERQVEADIGDALSQLRDERDKLREEVSRSQNHNRELVAQLDEALELVPSRKRGRIGGK